VNIQGVWHSFHARSNELLISDIIIRMCRGLIDVLIIIYVTNVIGITVAQYGFWWQYNW
jgi:hypothetical protein